MSAEVSSRGHHVREEAAEVAAAEVEAAAEEVAEVEAAEVEAAEEIGRAHV